MISLAAFLYVCGMLPFGVAYNVYIEGTGRACSDNELRGAVVLWPLCSPVLTSILVWKYYSRAIHVGGMRSYCGCLKDRTYRLVSKVSPRFKRWNQRRLAKERARYAAVYKANSEYMRSRRESGQILLDELREIIGAGHDPQ